MQTGKEYAMKKAMLLFMFSITALCLAAQSPEWQWASQAGGLSEDRGYSIAIDSNGNSYVTGKIAGTTTFGDNSLTANGGEDIFIAKLDSDGNHIWANQAGGPSNEYGSDITVDSSGNCYVTGYFRNTATFGNTNLTSSGDEDVYIAKLDSNGNWQWAMQAGGISSDSGISIATDISGNCFVTGGYSGTATFGTITLISTGGHDIYIAKLDSAGNWLWATQAGGNGLDFGQAISIDSNGNSYVTGIFYGSASFGTTSLTSIGYNDIFIAKLDNNGDWLWARQAGGTSTQYSYCITADSSGNSFVTGVFEGSAVFGQTTLTGSGTFAVKLDSNGAWLWAKKVGESSSIYGEGIVIDSDGNSYVAGSFYGTAIFGNTTLSSTGEYDIFVAKLDTMGNLLWVKKAGGSGDDRGKGIAIDSSGNLYVTGFFYGIAFFDSHFLINSRNIDIFVAKLGNPTGVSDEYEAPQAHFSLGQNRPNPFTATTSFSLEVSNAKDVYEVSVYDLRGRQISTLHRGVLPVGERSFTWNGKDHLGNQLASGVYFYRVTNGLNSQVKKMIYMR